MGHSASGGGLWSLYSGAVGVVYPEVWMLPKASKTGLLIQWNLAAIKWEKLAEVDTIIPQLNTRRIRLKYRLPKDKSGVHLGVIR